MSLDIIEKRFSTFLDNYWKLSDITPFQLVYIKLLLLFKGELSPVVFNVLLERQKQFKGEQFTNIGFEELRSLSRKEIDKDVGNTDVTRREALNRLIFCVLLDDEENDFFYLTEPLFEFAREMDIPPDQLMRILESEFAGLEDQWGHPLASRESDDQWGQVH